jgi:hypothetical protein
MLQVGISDSQIDKLHEAHLAINQCENPTEYHHIKFAYKLPHNVAHKIPHKVEYKYWFTISTESNVQK